MFSTLSFTYVFPAVIMAVAIVVAVILTICAAKGDPSDPKNKAELYTPTPASYEDAKAAKAEFRKRFENLPELRGVGIAVLNGGYGVAVRLSSPASQQLPAEISGVPVDIKIVGTIVALASDEPSEN